MLNEKKLREIKKEKTLKIPKISSFNSLIVLKGNARDYANKSAAPFFSSSYFLFSYHLELMLLAIIKS